MTDWVRWPNEADAQACLDAINGSQVFPITGENAASNETAEDKQKTTKWADLTSCADGKFGFAKPPDDLIADMGLDQDIFDGATTEAFDQDWISGEDGE